MVRRDIFSFFVVLLLGCAPVRARMDSGYQFALTEEEVTKIKRETFQEVLHRPHPAREREMIANLANEMPEERDDQPVKRFVSEEGFPLITFKGGPMTLGEALNFIAGSGGYRVEWQVGINSALPVSSTFTDTALHKAVAALIEPFGYSAVVDGKKGIVAVELTAPVDIQEPADSGKKRN